MKVICEKYGTDLCLASCEDDCSHAVPHSPLFPTSSLKTCNEFESPCVDNTGGSIWCMCVPVKKGAACAHSKS